jgi:hypothetical protein
MFNRLSAVSGFAALTMVLASTAFAQTAPAPAAPAETAATSAEDCLKAAFDIAQAAEDKQLPDTQLTKVEDMLTKMESHCDAKQFSEAATVGTDLRALIEKQ